jgi:hypothetical protein
MTFQEYCDQINPKRMPRVFVTPSDAYNVVELYGNTYITLKIHGEYYQYVLPKNRTSQILYTTDGDGNKKSMSCFIWQSN